MLTFFWKTYVTLLLLTPAFLHAMPDPVALANRDVPSIRCQQQSDQSDQLKLGLVESRLSSGAVHAAYAEVLALPAERAEVALLRANILRRLGRPEASQWFNALMKTCLKAEAAHGLGLLQAANKQWDVALDSLMMATRLRPNNSVMQSDLGFLLLSMGRFEQAEFAFRVAHELEPEAALPRANLQLLAIVSRNANLWNETSKVWPLTQDALEQLMKDCQRVVTTSPYFVSAHTACLLP